MPDNTRSEEIFARVYGAGSTEYLHMRIDTPAHPINIRLFAVKLRYNIVIDAQREGTWFTT